MVGSSLLAILDDYAVNDIEGDINFFLENIGNTLCTLHYFNVHLQYAALQTITRQLSTDSEDLIMTIDSSDLPSFSQPRMLIEIPPDLVKMFSSMSGMGSNGVRLVSFLYAHVTGLLPNSLPGEN